jgi:hypothetical protein
VPGIEPLFRCRSHFPVKDHVRAPADREVERPDLDDPESRPDLSAPFRRRPGACVLRNPNAL